jgi:hypothetical protein
LDDERRLTADVAAEEPVELFHVVNVVSADGVLAVGVFEELSGGYDHEKLRVEKLRDESSAIERV